jgi:hypothetical protein
MDREIRAASVPAIMSHRRAAPADGSASSSTAVEADMSADGPICRHAVGYGVADGVDGDDGHAARGGEVGGERGSPRWPPYLGAQSARTTARCVAKCAVSGGAEWVIIAYLVAIAATLLPFGHVSDLVGRKPVWVAGLAIFTVGSMLCGAALPWRCSSSPAPSRDSARP